MLLAGVLSGYLRRRGEMIFPVCSPSSGACSVRHKALDLIGDLALLGAGLQGHVRVERGGHGLHHQLVRAILAEPAAWEILGSEMSGPGWPASAALP